MTTLKQVQQRIDDLVAQDKRDEKQVNTYYQQALTVIKNSLSAFLVDTLMKLVYLSLT